MTHERKAPAVFGAALLLGLIAGAALGVIWWRLAPRVSLVVRPADTRPADFQPNAWIAADVTFAALAIAAGIGVTVALISMRRQHLLTVLPAALAASVVGTLAMAILGERLGAVDIAGLQATLDAEAVVEGPLTVTMPAVFLAWPIAAAIVVTVVAFGDWLHDRRRASGPGDGGRRGLRDRDEIVGGEPDVETPPTA